MPKFEDVMLRAVPADTRELVRTVFRDETTSARRAPVVPRTRDALLHALHAASHVQRVGNVRTLHHWLELARVLRGAGAHTRHPAMRAAVVASHLSGGASAARLLAAGVRGDVRVLRRVAHAEPGNVSAWRLLAAHHVQQRAWEDALRALQRALDIERRDHALWLDVATVLEAMGHMQVALVCAENALALASESVRVWLRLGRLHARLGHMDTAERYLQRAVAGDPTHAPARRALATVRAHITRRNAQRNT